MKMATKRKKVVVTMIKRLEALTRIDKGEPMKNIAAELGVGSSTVSDWKKNRKEIEYFCAKVVSVESLAKRGTVKRAKNELLDDALLLWFNKQRELGTLLTGPILQSQALLLNKQMNGDPTFSASVGWLHRWKCRHGIRQFSMARERHSLAEMEYASQETSEDENYKKKFMKIILEENLMPDQIYNADETTLFYKLLPDKAISQAPNKHKKCEDQVTCMLLVCANASGKHKLPLVFVENTAKPSALKNVHAASLPVVYKSSSCGWMDSAMFKEWFFRNFAPSVEKHLKSVGLPVKAVLFLDDAPHHPDASELVSGNISVRYFPPNVASSVQPMEQGVIENLKRRYRKELLIKLVEEEQEKERDVLDMVSSVGVKDVAYVAADVWDLASRIGLVQSWEKLWPGIENVVGAVDAEIEDDVSAPAFVEIFKHLKGCGTIDENDVDVWMNSEEDFDRILLTVDEIVSACLRDPVTSARLSEDEGEADGQASITHGEGLRMLDGVLTYLEQQSDTSPAELLTVKRIRDRSARKRAQSLKMVEK